MSSTRSELVSKAAGLLTDFERGVRRSSNSTDAFVKRFSELCRENDRPAMIDYLLRSAEAPITEIDSRIGETFRAKDEERAVGIFEEIGSVCESSLITAALNVDKLTAVLTEALVCAPPRSSIFFRVLLQRARAWYRAGDLLRCDKDCRFFCQSASNATVEDDDWMEESRVEVLLMLSDCLRRNKVDVTEAKNALNEAMRRIDHLAKSRTNQLSETSQEQFKIEKAQLLKHFLEKKQSLALSQTLIDAAALSAKANQKTRIPTVDGVRNEYLSCCSDACALGNDEVKGRKLYATRDIKPGTVLIVDQPFAFSTDIAALSRNCLHCHTSFKLAGTIRVPCENCQAVQFCSDDCRLTAWNTFHKYECRIFDYFYARQAQRTSALLAYRTVVSAALSRRNDKIDEEFLTLHKNDQSNVDVTSFSSYEARDYRTVFNLETHCNDMDPMDSLQRAIHSIFFAKSLIYSLNYFHPKIDNHERHLHILAVALLHNMQAINCNAYEIVENVRDNETKIFEPRNVGGAIYTSVSLTNHSCYPNVVRHSFPNGNVVVTALRYIPEGSEILDCYGQHFLENKTDARRKLLAKKYYFDCKCEPCVANWPIVLPSDKFNFKCEKCLKKCRRTRNATECTTCGRKTETNKLYALLQTSMKKRLAALTKMYDGQYQDALPLLLEHANCIGSVLSEPSLEAVKTQQSIIQCLNAMSSTSI